MSIYDSFVARNDLCEIVSSVAVLVSCIGRSEREECMESSLSWASLAEKKKRDSRDECKKQLGMTGRVRKREREKERARKRERVRGGQASS